MARERVSSEARRERYRLQKEFREIAKRRSHVCYRNKNPKKESKIKHGLIISGKEKEVYKVGSPSTVYKLEVYTVIGAAKALGKTTLTFKKWIRKGIVPAPLLRCTIFRYKHYTIEEVQSIANILRIHEKEYDYIHHSHDSLVRDIHKAVEIVRGYGYGEPI